VGALTLVALPAHAQSDAGRSTGNTLEEIVATATRVETNLQQTPMSVTVLSGEELEQRGIDQGRDLGIMVPNVVLNPGALGELAPSMLMRGLPGVTTYVDGVWFGNLGFLQRSFVETERVEVLRGPQGTLFGRNSNGGAIQVVTRRPADTFRMRLDAGLGELDRRTLRFSADIPVSQRLKTKWTVAIDTSHGFMQSRSASFALGDEDNSLVRGDVLWQPNDRFSLRFNLNEEDRRGSPARVVRFSNPQYPELIAYNVLAGNPDYLNRARAIDPAFPDPPFALPADRFTAQTHEAGFPGGALGRWETRSDTVGPTIVDQRFALLTLDWNITERFKLESLTGYVKSDASESGAFDGSEFTLLSRVERDHTDLTTQELHLTGHHLNGRLQTLLGLYYSDFAPWTRAYQWDEWEFAVPNTGPSLGGPGPPGVAGRPLQNQAALAYVRAWGATVGNPAVATFSPWTWNSSDTLGWGTNFDRALFGQLKIGVTQKLDVTLGFRFTTHDGDTAGGVPAQSFRPAQPDTVAPGDPYAVAAVLFRVDDPDVGTVSTPKLAISYQATDDVYLYASYAEGFTSPAVVSPAGQPILLDAEVVRSREVGMRSDWLRHRLRFNATYFDSRWDGLRVPKISESTGLPVPTSDGVGRASGLEAELLYLPSQRWELDLAVGLLDTEYLDIGIPPANGSGLQPGTPFAYAPKKSYSLGVKYRLPLASRGEVLLVGDYGRMGEYQRGPSNERQTKNADGSDRPEPAYGILNARLIFKPANRDWQLSLFGTNLANAWYLNGGFDARAFAGYDFGTIGRPREAGVGIKFTFD
jgi:iron complex outermembrane receptor protein